MTLLARQSLAQPGEPYAPVRADKPSATLNLLLVSGGDERLQLDPATGCNKYGTTPAPAPDALWFSSSTAATITPRGYGAAGRALASLFADMPGDRLNLAPWFDALRARLLALYGVLGAEAVLAGSGTELELVALSFALQGDLTTPLVNVVVAPSETGSGVPLAAAGRYFLATSSLSGQFVHRERLQGWEDADITVESLAIRTADGALRPAVEVDADAVAIATAALGRKARVLLHVLDASKTGQAGVSRAAARAIKALDPARVTVVVDACQLRCTPAEIRADLDAGHLVMITGSKFAGGPPFSGALLVPASVAADAQTTMRLPQGFAAYGAALDWPECLRTCGADVFTTPANLGLGLRWEAALAELEALATVPADLQATIQRAFGQAVTEAIAARPELTLLDGEALALPSGRLRTIFPFGLTAATAQDMVGLHHALRRGDKSPACHLGQLVHVGHAGALRLCLSAPHITAVAARMAGSSDCNAALAPLLRDIGIVFDRLDGALRRMAEGR